MGLNVLPDVTSTVADRGQARYHFYVKTDTVPLPGFPIHPLRAPDVEYDVEQGQAGPVGSWTNWFDLCIQLFGLSY